MNIAEWKKNAYLHAKDRKERAELRGICISPPCVMTRGDIVEIDGKKTQLWIHADNCPDVRTMRDYAKYAAPPQTELEFAGNDQAG